MIKLDMNLMIDIPTQIQLDTDYYSEEEIKYAITMLFAPNYKFNPCLAPELQVVAIQRMVMNLLRSESFQRQWMEKKTMKCQTQGGLTPFEW